MDRLPTLLLSLAAALPSLHAQLPLISAVPVEKTQVPVFTDFKPAEAEQTVEHPNPLANFRLHLEYRLPEASAKLSVHLGDALQVSLPTKSKSAWSTLELQFERLTTNPGQWSATVDGEVLADSKVVPSPPEVGANFDAVRLDGDFTVMVKFASRGSGALFSKCRTEKWEPGAKMLGIRDGRLFYDIGWLGVVTSRTDELADGQPHAAVVRSSQGRVTLFVDGRVEGRRERHSMPDARGHAFHVGRGSKGFDGDLKDGTVENLRYWDRALNDDEARQICSGRGDSANTPSMHWTSQPGVATFPNGIPGLPIKLTLTATGGAEIRNAWAQPLGEANHAKIISQWGEKSLGEGAKIYQQLCVTCHGTPTQEGSMPTSRRFHKEPFKNGSDPFRQFQTLTQGYGLMMPMPQYTAEQKYAVIQYIRETFIQAHNKGELSPVDPAYLASLPLAMRTLPSKPAPIDHSQQYLKMNYGPMLEWTYQVAPDNLAYKGIVVRLDAGDGGVSKGRTWIVFDHDTMRVATATTGTFMDWKGVAFDGSHGTHPTLTGQSLFVNPVGPGWANPQTGSWDDTRFIGRDGKRYGPLPRDWARFLGTYLHGQTVVQSYAIGEASVLDAAEMADYGQHPVLIRTLNVAKTSQNLKMRIAPLDDSISICLTEADGLKVTSEEGCSVLAISADRTPINFRLALSKGLDPASLEALLKGAQLPKDLSSLAKGGPPRWPQLVKTQALPGTEEGAFATDVLTHPDGDLNPWGSWMRLTGFDFFADGNRAAVCTWMGDVWTVDAVAAQPLGTLTWRRICTGLFQPLGLKIVNESIFVTCRDQIARLHDLNGDTEIDFIECFNNDQQVTEHFHEFAMGLQTDAKGNFYYAKSACHARPAAVAQHGTLLRVSADGSRTDILASGFRAANGVCLNPDGTFFVTDQEGHWTPKNRINRVHGDGPSEFFGNMMSYHAGTDEADTAMRQPLCWITNAFDRSPSELLWVPRNAQWGPLNGALLNLSYGYGKIYTVPFEEKDGVEQGGMCALPMPQFPTGVMRGRFHPGNGQLYGCGMFAWAGNQSQSGGFYRVRYTGQPALQPLGLHFETGLIQVTFSDPLDEATARNASQYSIKAWNLKRSANYGSAHLDEHSLSVREATLSADHKSLRLTVPDLCPTMGLEIVCKLRTPSGDSTERVIHGTIHRL